MLTLEEIGTRIQIARVTYGLNQVQLSDKLKEQGLHISRETISKIESGDRPLSAMELPVFAAVLSVPLTELLKEEMTEDLVTLFRRKAGVSIVDEEISEIQDMMKALIKQKQLYEGKLIVRKREPRWRV
jgi:transcriptional regulator with XRE-family HTH domain